MRGFLIITTCSQFAQRTRSKPHLKRGVAIGQLVCRFPARVQPFANIRYPQLAVKSAERGLGGRERFRIDIRRGEDPADRRQLHHKRVHLIAFILREPAIASLPLCKGTYGKLSDPINKSGIDIVDRASCPLNRDEKQTKVDRRYRFKLGGSRRYQIAPLPILCQMKRSDRGQFVVQRSSCRTLDSRDHGVTLDLRAIGAGDERQGLR